MVMKVIGDNGGNGDNWDSVVEGVEDDGPDIDNSDSSAEEDGSRDDGGCKGQGGN